jgi:2-methylcitrate dehydratase
MYIFTVALQDGRWHHVDSYLPERAGRPDTVKLWHKCSTQEDAAWTARYHNPDPSQKAFGARVEITFNNGQKLVDEMAVANAHAFGAKPFARPDYVRKFKTLTEGLVSLAESERFLGLVNRLPTLSAAELLELNVQVESTKLSAAKRDTRGIF